MLAQPGGFGLGGVESGQQFFRVAVVVFGGVRVLDVQVVAAPLDFVRRHLPGAFRCLAALAFRPAPPVDAGLQVFQPDGPGHGVGFLALRHEVFVEPDVPGGLALFEEEQVGADGGIGPEDGVGQAHDGVQVALLQQVLLEPRLDALAEQGAVGQHHGGAPAGLQQPHDQGQEQVGGFLGSKVLGEVALDAVFFLAAEGRVGQHDVDAVLLLPADVGPRQGVVVTHEAGVLDAVQQHVGDAQHVRKLLFLHGAQGGLHGVFVLGPLDVAVAHVAQGTGQEPAGAAGRVEQGLSRLGVDAVGHEGGDGSWGVVLAGVAGGLQVVEDLFVDVAKVLARGQVVEVDIVDLVDHLAHQLAGLHVVVGILEDIAHHPAAVSGLAAGAEVLQGGEQVVVDKGQQGVAG